MLQVYFTVKDGIHEINKIENKDPRTFPDVKVFAGDKFLPPADVAYRNLTWELNVKSDLLSGVVRMHREIGTIESWGPHFRVSFEMIIKSFEGGRWTNILSFRGNEARDCPSVFLQNNKRYIAFTHPVNGNEKYSSHWDKKVKLNKWYKIIIEQISINGKVRILDIH